MKKFMFWLWGMKPYKDHHDQSYLSAAERQSMMHHISKTISWEEQKERLKKLGIKL